MIGSRAPQYATLSSYLAPTYQAQLFLQSLLDYLLLAPGSKYLALLSWLVYYCYHLSHVCFRVVLSLTYRRMDKGTTPSGTKGQSQKQIWLYRLSLYCLTLTLVRTWVECVEFSHLESARCRRSAC